MTDQKHALMQWAQQGQLNPDDLQEALRLTGITPTRQSWHYFIDRLLLWSGASFLCLAVVFFFAFNWQALGRYAKFSLAEGLILLSLALYWKLGHASAGGKAALFSGAGLVGALLALYGQTYQTGADPWQLFATWAALITPWALLGQMPALWALWVLLLNIALFLYLDTFGSLFRVYFGPEDMGYLFFCLNAGIQLVWETCSYRLRWLATRWPLRLLALASGSCITLLALEQVFEHHNNHNLALLIFSIWLAGIYGAYRHLKADLFMLAGASLAAIILITAILARALLNNGSDGGGFLLIALAVIGMSAGAAAWLKRIAAEQSA